jgi:LPS export ABC transporter protein LptC
MGRSVWGWVLAALALSLAGCGDAEPGRAVVENEGPEQTTYEYHTTQTKLGVPEWELWGEQAVRYSGSAERDLTGVKMVFYKAGERDAVLTSETGKIDEETQATVAEGNVVVISEDGRKLESEVLHWDPKRQLIYTGVETFVKISEGDRILTGYGLETDPDLTDLVILKQVESEVPADESASSAESSPR